FRDLPPSCVVGAFCTRDTPDMRNFPPQVNPGFSWSQNVHSDVGVGLRFFLRSVAVPLVGIDVGWGLTESRILSPQYLIVVGA
ncbi:MAG TPA: hypothetical protein VLA14_11355, partial [Polyangia bacterium]|nr:hypothetical protein [Polyangia bacterium]